MNKMEKEIKKYIKNIILETINNNIIKEEYGVPEDALKASSLLEKEIEKSFENGGRWVHVYDSKDNLVENVQKMNKIIHIDGFQSNLFFDDLNIHVSFIQVNNENISDEIIEKSNRGEEINQEVKINSQTKKLEYADIKLNICFRSNDVLNENVKNLILHELTHIYETYQRKLHNKTKKTKDDVYNAININVISNETIKKINFLIYCTLYFEKNANISALYKNLMHTSSLSLENIKQDFLNSIYYKNFLLYLKSPELYITEEEIKILNDKDFAELNNQIKNLSQNYGFKNINNFLFYYKGDKKQYFDKIFNYSKNIYEKIYKKCQRVIFKAYKDKNPTFIQEGYRPDRQHVKIYPNFNNEFLF